MPRASCEPPGVNQVFKSGAPLGWTAWRPRAHDRIEADLSTWLQHLFPFLKGMAGEKAAAVVLNNNASQRPSAPCYLQPSSPIATDSTPVGSWARVGHY